jgi:hypothetical protein
MPGNNYETAAIVERGDSTIVYDAAPPLKSTDVKLEKDLVEQVADKQAEENELLEELARVKRERAQLDFRLKACRERLVQKRAAEVAS